MQQGQINKQLECRGVSAVSEKFDLVLDAGMLRKAEAVISDVLAIRTCNQTAHKAATKPWIVTCCVQPPGKHHRLGCCCKNTAYQNLNINCVVYMSHGRPACRNHSTAVHQWFSQLIVA